MSAPVFHELDDVEVLNPKGKWVHGVVHEVCAFCVWISADDCMVDLPFDPRDPHRIRLVVAS
jgi:hypothetical protein